MKKSFKTRITEMLGIEYPILCGGMQWVSKAEFMSHVSNAGGLGFITAESFESPDMLREEIKKMRTLTDKPFGVNLSMVPELGIPERTIAFAEVICEEGVTVVETAGSSPGILMERFKEAEVRVIHKCTSVRHAISAQKIGVDAITILGYGSGGHIGNDDVAAFILLPLALRQLGVPVIAGGGIASGAGLLGALAMGADAVLMGTAFFVAEESPVHPVIKEKMIAATERDTTVLMRSIKNPLRVVKNKLSEQVLDVEARGGTLQEIIALLAGGKGKLAYDVGDTEISPLASGQTIGLVNEVKTVKSIIDDMVAEASELMERLSEVTS